MKCGNDPCISIADAPVSYVVLKRGDCGEQVFDIFTHECVPEESVVGPLSDGHCYEKQGLMKYP